MNGQDVVTGTQRALQARMQTTTDARILRHHDGN
jgi:hypothetical protein